MNKTIRILIMHHDSVAREGLRSFIEHDPCLSVVSKRAENFEDGVALYRDELRNGRKPDLLLFDMNLSVAHNQRVQVSPDLLSEFKEKTGVPIILLYAPPASLTSAALLLYCEVACAFIETPRLRMTTLNLAVAHALQGQPYIYYDRQERRLYDLIPGQEFFTLKDHEVTLLEYLAKRQSPKAMRGDLALSSSGVYRRLDELEKVFDIRSWKYAVRHAQSMGILRDSKVVWRTALRRSAVVRSENPYHEKSADIFPSQKTDSNLLYLS